MNLKFERNGLEISFKDHFDDYKTFMDTTRDPIYRTILSAFKTLNVQEKASIVVKAKVLDTEFESELEFSKEQIDILIDVINPYFEEIEDYETCAEIMTLIESLIGKNSMV